MKVNSISEYFESENRWKAELMLLREIILSTSLIETLKWGTPVYTLENKNIVGIGAFKSYFGLWFFQGALLKDDQKILTNAQEGKTNALRHWRFHTLDELKPELIRNYIFEAIQNQKEGKEIKPNRKKPLNIPPEIQCAIEKDLSLGKSFSDLGLSKRREYAEYITEAKRPSTKQGRLEKIIPMIKAGKGLHDKYKKC